ncbi:hypothetical protein [Pseudomonas aeruginosa]|nr:hypothetical protein [Pseudomonas aeruginosa]
MAFGPLDPLQWGAAAPEAMDDAAAPAQIDPPGSVGLSLIHI